jgi:hypothetical protein
MRSFGSKLYTKSTFFTDHILQNSFDIEKGHLREVVSNLIFTYLSALTLFALGGHYVSPICFFVIQTSGNAYFNAKRCHFS